MLIIAYFLGLVLAIGLILLILPYISRVVFQPQQKPLLQKFNNEHSPELTEKLDQPLNYWWKGPLNKALLSPELPEKYDDSRLILMVRNPHCLYAFWEISSTYMDSLSHTYGEEWFSGAPVLRVYESPTFTSEDSHCLLDIEISHEANNWYINVPAPNRYYYVELGRKLTSGLFIPILRSETVITPRFSVSTIIDEDWIPCDVYQRMGPAQYGTSSPELTRKD